MPAVRPAPRSPAPARRAVRPRPRPSAHRLRRTARAEPGRARGDTCRQGRGRTGDRAGDAELQRGVELHRAAEHTAVAAGECMRAAAALASSRRAGQRARSVSSSSGSAITASRPPPRSRRSVARSVTTMPASAGAGHVAHQLTTAVRSPAPAATFHIVFTRRSVPVAIDGVVRRSRSVTPSIERASGERSAVASVPSTPATRRVSRACTP